LFLNEVLLGVLEVTPGMGASFSREDNFSLAIFSLANQY